MSYPGPIFVGNFAIATALVLSNDTILLSYIMATMHARSYITNTLTVLQVTLQIAHFLTNGYFTLEKDGGSTAPMFQIPSQV